MFNFLQQHTPQTASLQSGSDPRLGKRQLSHKSIFVRGIEPTGLFFAFFLRGGAMGLVPFLATGFENRKTSATIERTDIVGYLFWGGVVLGSW